MRRQQTLVAVIAVAVLFVFPFAWGCEGTGMQDCEMSDCAMAALPAASDCHAPETSPQGLASGCDDNPEMWIACCDSPVDPEPAKFDPGSTLDLGASSLILLAEQVRIEPLEAPPDSMAARISSQRHELGRFTLLASFLL